MCGIFAAIKAFFKSSVEEATREHASRPVSELASRPNSTASEKSVAVASASSGSSVAGSCRCGTYLSYRPCTRNPPCTPRYPSGRCPSSRRLKPEQLRRIPSFREKTPSEKAAELEELRAGFEWAYGPAPDPRIPVKQKAAPAAPLDDDRDRVRQGATCQLIRRRGGY